EELTKAVVETVNSGANAGKAAVLSVAAASPAVPVTLQASLMARLDRLGSTAKEGLQTGAVIGRDFSYGLLAAGGPWTDWELRGALPRLVAAGSCIPARDATAGELPLQARAGARCRLQHVAVRSASFIARTGRPRP